VRNIDVVGGVNIAIKICHDTASISRYTIRYDISCHHYSFLWSGPAPGTPRSAGVSLAFDRDAYRAMTSWHPINERIIVADFKHTFGKLHVVAAYAPPDTATTVQKDAYYAILDQVTSTYRTGHVLCLDIGFCLTGPISLCVDLFVFVFVFCVFLFYTA